MAALSPADEIYYGGAAGGGKSDLLLGLALTAHQKSIIFRRELTQLSGPSGLIERSREIVGKHGRYNGLEHAWRDLPGDRAIEFGAVQYERDRHKYQGRPHDFIAFDELPEFLESQYRFLIGWLRTTDEGQRCRVICAGNPPMHADGEWVIQHWGPWLDEQQHWGPWLDEHHPNPAAPGELRWFAVIDGDDEEVNGPTQFDHNGQAITPKSRTFIPARLGDNPFLAATEYGATLNNLPEPLRTQLLYGDFMTAMGVDVARGGSDQMVLAKRYDSWFAPLVKRSGRDTPDGPTVAALVIVELGSDIEALINVDVIGVGSSAYDSLAMQEIAHDENEQARYANVVGVNFAEGTSARDRSGMLAMRNIRAEGYWALREALDPVKGDDLALPPDRELLADLVAPKWKLSAQGIQIESKEDIKKRIGRSTDCGDAVVLAHYGSYGAWMTLLDN
jgi:hypothetical protein